MDRDRMAGLSEEVARAAGEGIAAPGGDGGFRCARCGNCCRGEGVVLLTADDIARISDFLELTQEQFLRQYTRRVPGVRSAALMDQDDAAISCVFLREGACAIDAVKPYQCASFPLLWTRSDAMEICKALQSREP